MSMIKNLNRSKKKRFVYSYDFLCSLYAALKFLSDFLVQNAGIGVGKLHQHQLSKPGSPKLTKLDENKKGKHRVPNQTKREHISKRTKQHGKNVGPPKQQKQPAGKMKFSKKLPESKSGLISFLCSILTMFNLKNLILIKWEWFFFYYPPICNIY